MTNLQLKTKYYEYKAFLRSLSDVSFRFDRLTRDPQFTTAPFEETVSLLQGIVEDAKTLLQNAPNKYDNNR